MDAGITVYVKKVDRREGDVITFVKNLPHRNMYNELFRKHPGYDGTFDIVGTNETLNRNIIDVFSGSEAQIRNAAPKNYHYGVDSFDQRQVYVTDGNDVYRLELNVANLSGGQKVAYVKRIIEKAGAEVSEKIKKAETAGKTRLNQPSGTSIRNPEQVVKKKLQMGDRDPAVLRRHSSSSVGSGNGRNTPVIPARLSTRTERI